MSYPPQTLLDLRDYLRAETGLSLNELGIVGDANHTYGYHLGEDRLPKDDYSARQKRDIAGLTDAASASDIGMFDRLVALTDYLVSEGRAGRANDIREIIGPATNGRAYRYDSLSGWNPQLRPQGDPHEWHCHVSWFRDSEFREKVSLFERFFDHTSTTEGPTMLLAQVKGQAEIYRSDGRHYWHMTSYSAVQALEAAGNKVAQFASLADLEDACGTPAAGEVGGVDVKALAEALKPFFLTADQTREIVREELDNTRLSEIVTAPQG